MSTETRDVCDPNPVPLIVSNVPPLMLPIAGVTEWISREKNVALCMIKTLSN